MFARSSSRSFESWRIGYGCLSRSSWWLGFDPRGRSDLVGEHLRDRQDMIGQSCGHGRGTRISKVPWFAQFVMREAEVVSASNQVHAGFERLQASSGMPTFARERSQT